MSGEKRRLLRQEIRKNRNSISLETVQRNSERIIRNLLTLDILNKARVIMGYVAVENEVDIWPYLKMCLDKGKTVLLPRVEKDLDVMVAIQFSGTDNMRTGSFGIREPLGDPFPPERIEAVIVPGIAFDRQGYRLGYGKGYYDRFLPLLSPSTFICGVAHSLQVIEDIMPHGGDFRIPCLVTEQEIQFCETADPHDPYPALNPTTYPCKQRHL